jgi:hypothetical protein
MQMFFRASGPTKGVQFSQPARRRMRMFTGGIAVDLKHHQRVEADHHPIKSTLGLMRASV